MSDNRHSIAQKWERRKLKFRNSWDKIQFNLFMQRQTCRGHNAVLAAAEQALGQFEHHESEAACLQSNDPVVRQGWRLKQQLEEHFRGLHANASGERILIHVPAPNYSPAGYSLFTNLAESLTFIGIPTRILDWNEPTKLALEEFQPTVLLTSDHHTYLSRIDWDSIASYRCRMVLRVGLTAALEEYGNSPLSERLAWAKAHGVDFFYTFRDRDYVSTRQAYSPFHEGGYPILDLPFGANILHYYPVAGFERDLDFVLLATRKSEHMGYLKDIVRTHSGFIDGPGWRHVKQFTFNRARDRYIYARAKVGLNVHLPEQLEWACEVNERTYQLAACGVPQLIDHPLVLDKLYGPGTFFVAESPSHYRELFAKLMAQPELAIEQALAAQRETFARHTTFHRADAFVAQLKSMRKVGSQ